MWEVPPYAEPDDGRFMLDRDRRSPLWEQIARVLEREIRRGRLEPGDKLPPEARLARWFGVNRHTVRRALARMGETGLVKAEQGRGTFVSRGVVDYLVSRRTRFGENLSRQNRASHGELVRSEVLEADEAVSMALRVDTVPVLALHILRHGDGQPLSFSSHYFPLPRFAGLADSFRATGSITRSLARHGVGDYFREETRILARQPTAEEAELLGLPRTRPVLVTRSVNVDEHGRPVDYGVARYASDRFELVVRSVSG